MKSIEKLILSTKLLLLCVVLLSFSSAVFADESSQQTTAHEKQQNITFPSGDLFRPLVADPKQPRFFAGYRRYDYKSEKINGAAVGFGETFGLYRHNTKEKGNGLQLNIAGAVFAQFNLDAPSHELVNADYIIGFPATYRRGPFSARFNIYHQSSHLGDEFLLRARPERINLSFESVNLVTSYEWKEWRGYLGGEYLFHREPSNLHPAGAHGGIEYYGSKKIFGIGRFVGGLDLKSYEEHHWSVDTSLNMGFEFGQPDPGQRRLRLMAEAYKGFSPYGQFYNDTITYYGVGIFLGF